MNKWEDKKDEILKMVFEDSLSYEKIGEKYGVTGAAIKKILIKMGINLPQRRKINQSENFNKGKHIRKKEKVTKKDAICKVCGKQLIGKQRKFCSIKCKNIEYSREKYHTKYSKKRDEKGLLLKEKYISKKGGKCEICGYDKNYSALVFHHINPEEKKFELTSRNLVRYSLEEIEKEVNKCIVLCQNCHCEIHYPNCKNKK